MRLREIWNRLWHGSFTSTDRYEAIGMPRPDPKTMCDGQCEGTGFVPVYMAGEKPRAVHPEDETDPLLIALWQVAEDEKPAEDGWHFVKCPDCGGSGKAGKVTFSGPTFEIIPPTSQAPFGIKCLVCGRTSWNENDVKQRYCGNCHQYHEFLAAERGGLG